MCWLSNVKCSSKAVIQEMHLVKQNAEKAFMGIFGHLKQFSELSPSKTATFLCATYTDIFTVKKK